MKVSLLQARKDAVSAVKVSVVPMIWGSPAIGKSSIVHEIAKEFGLKVIDLRLAQCDPTDLLGFPQVEEVPVYDDQGNVIGETKRASYVPMATFPLEGSRVPKGYNGWLLFLDELTSASRAVQAAAYKLILDRMVGQFRLHKNVAIIGAGNLETDNAIVEPMSTALQSRLIHLEVELNYKEWLDWAAENKIDHRITSFIKFKPDNLYTFDPKHTDKTYGSPRTWEFANRFIAQEGIVDKGILSLLAGTISEGLAREFIGFCQIYADLPSIDRIMEEAKTINVPEEPSILYALTGCIANYATEDTVGPLMDYVARLPIEFQVVTVRDMVRRNKKLLSQPAVQKWTSNFAHEMF